MKNELTNEEYRKVFGMYIGGLVLATRYHYGNDREEMMPGYLTGIHGELEAEIQFFTEDGMHAEEEPEYRSFKETKLQLTPLALITDEHAIQVAKMIRGDRGERDTWKVERYGSHIYFLDVVRGDESVNIYWLGCAIKSYISLMPCSEDTFLAWQYLHSMGYAVPIWLGLGHWANDKTAIKLGISVDLTTLNKKNEPTS